MLEDFILVLVDVPSRQATMLLVVLVIPNTACVSMS